MPFQNGKDGWYEQVEVIKAVVWSTQSYGAKYYAVHKEEENGKMEYVVVEAAVVMSELRKYWLVGEVHSLTDIINKRTCNGHTLSHGGLLVDVKKKE